MYLTEKELTYLSDTDFLLTKRNIQDKVNQLLVETEEKLKDAIRQHKLVVPARVQSQAGKISKGENYQGLPYQILDFPRLFSRDDIFAYRTMCWWGNYYSATWHLQGKSWQALRKTLIAEQRILREEKAFICVHHTPWEYHQQEDNFLSIESFSEKSLSEHFERMHFMKIARFLPLEDGGKLPAFSLNFFKRLNTMMQP